MTPPARLATVAKIIMGQSPPGDSYNRTGEGLPLLNGPTEFGATSPECTLFTTDSRRECEASDLIFCVRGSTTGRMNWADRKYSLGRGVCSIRGASPPETRFIRYCVEDQLHALLQLAGGGTFPNLSKVDIEQFQIPWPENRIRIAGILSAYDDLIENNQRRIKILEEMARSLYLEWFVHFRFPGHEKVKMVPSAIGIIPQGWEVKQLGELATVTMGLSPKGDTYNEEENGMPLVNGPVEFGDRFTKRMKWTTEPTKFCKEGDLVVCVRGSTTGKYVKSDGVYCLGRGVCGISSQHQCFIELLFEHELPTLLSQTSGSTFPSWTGPQLKSHPVVAPPAEILGRFDALVKPMSVAVLAYSRQIQNLRRTRDLLLPRLLSGQIELKSMEAVA